MQGNESYLYGYFLSYRLLFTQCSEAATWERSIKKVLQLGLACNLIKKETLAKVFFLWILWNFQEHLFYRTPPGDCFWLKHMEFSYKQFCLKRFYPFYPFCLVYYLCDDFLNLGLQIVGKCISDTLFSLWK